MSDTEDGFDQSSFEKHDKKMKRFRQSHPTGNWNTARNERAHCTGEAGNDCLHLDAEPAGNLRHAERRGEPAQRRDRVSLMKLLDLIPICGEVELPDKN